MLDADAMKAFDADGNLLPMKLEYIKSGDGINTTDEVVKTETLPQKIVYATVNTRTMEQKHCMTLCIMVESHSLRRKAARCSLQITSCFPMRKKQV